MNRRHSPPTNQVAGRDLWRHQRPATFVDHDEYEPSTRTTRVEAPTWPIRHTPRAPSTDTTSTAEATPRAAKTPDSTTATASMIDRKRIPLITPPNADQFHIRRESRAYITPVARAMRFLRLFNPALAKIDLKWSCTVCSDMNRPCASVRVSLPRTR